MGVWLVWGLVSLLSELAGAFVFLEAVASVWVASGAICLLNSLSSDVIIVLRWVCIAVI